MKTTMFLRPGLIIAPLFFSAFFLLLSDFAYAGSATWNLDPADGEWGRVINWTPRTIPRTRNDVATFDVSNTTQIGVGRVSPLDSIVFTPEASAYTITLGVNGAAGFNFWGAGIINNSGLTQNFVAQTSGISNSAFLEFRDSATAGTNTYITVKGASDPDVWASCGFSENASAGSATIVLEGGAVANGSGGLLLFDYDTTAANSTIIINAGAAEDAFGGYGELITNASAGHATIITNGASLAGALGGRFIFGGNTPGQATLIANGSPPGSADNSSEASGGGFYFYGPTNPGTPRVELHGNGSLDISSNLYSSATVGSLEGDGQVYLGHRTLTVGSNNLSTIFSGVIQDGGINNKTQGSILKSGTGTLTLSGSNTYTGNTTILGGFLRVSNATGSGTGFGALHGNTGTLGGNGIVAGAVTVGSGSGPGAFLAPGTGASILTLQSALSFQADGTYTCRIRTTSAQTDNVIANGVTIASGAQFSPLGIGNATLPVGTVFTAINNTATPPISGTFSNLPDGSTITVGSNTLQANYEGGDGNDLTLTVIP